ncbi:unnamed protein product [Trichogramma brassicae]|uniref:Uncharacterized protein n=1 Tax=Trichogramma brassicae TaxID=86971 RepID=A0A6H5IK33_9HYME|nr:unnamed protein product [Trichogramma brassicae]
MAKTEEATCIAEACEGTSIAVCEVASIAACVAEAGEATCVAMACEATSIAACDVAGMSDVCEVTGSLGAGGNCADVSRWLALAFFNLESFSKGTLLLDALSSPLFCELKTVAWISSWISYVESMLIGDRFCVEIAGKQRGKYIDSTRTVYRFHEERFHPKGQEDIHTYGHLLRIQCSLQICKPNCPTRSGSKSHFRAYHRASSMRKQKKTKLEIKKSSIDQALEERESITTNGRDKLDKFKRARVCFVRRWSRRPIPRKVLARVSRQRVVAYFRCIDATRRSCECKTGADVPKLNLFVRSCVSNRAEFFRNEQATTRSFICINSLVR